MRPGKIIGITFDTFLVEADSDCRYDSLTLYEFIDGDYDQVKKICGTDVPEPYTSKSEKIKIHFKSDNTQSLGGFKLTYTERDRIQTTTVPGELKSYLILTFRYNNF